MIRVTTASDRRFYMEIGADQGHGIRVIYAGPYGQLVVDELAGTMWLAVREEENRNLPTTRYGESEVETTFKVQPYEVIGPSRAVLEALLNDGNPPTGEDGRLTIAVLVAAYVSNENGHRPVRIDDPGLPREHVFPWA